MKKVLAKFYIWLLLFILYSPIIIIAVFSFTEAKVLGNWTGFSTKLYANVFNSGLNNSLIKAIENTISIGLISAFCSTILGSFSAIGIFNLHGKKRRAISFINDIPMLNPDIITFLNACIGVAPRSNAAS